MEMTREEAIDELKILKEDYWDDDGYGHETEQYNSTMFALDMAIQALEQEPKMGHWKAFIHSAYHGTDEDGEPIWREVTVYHCSQCNRRTVIKENFCPFCGAKMESEE